MGLAEYILLPALALFLVIGIFIGGVYALKAASPWWSEKTGEAELRQAEQNRQIVIEEAMADNIAAESRAEAQIKIAKAQAQAEIERAKGVAEANRIVGDSLRGNEEYLRYLFIDQIRSTDNQIIYLPTEAGLPILEAKR